MTKPTLSDIIILGAGAAGMMCAVEAGQNGQSAILIDHAKSAGDKIRISGGGRCNFTNLHCSPSNFISQNPHFVISPLKAYGPQDFIEKVKSNGIAFHEKTLGQLFCDVSAKEIIQMLINDLKHVGAKLFLQTNIISVSHKNDKYYVTTDRGDFCAKKLVIALGGKSIPKMGATSLGYDLAQQFGHKIVETRPALVPFTWPSAMKEFWGNLSGVSQFVDVKCGKTNFKEALLFTHRGISGPAMLQISSYWREGDKLEIDFLPSSDLGNLLKEQRQNHPNIAVNTMLTKFIPKRLAQSFMEIERLANKPIGELNNKILDALSLRLKNFEFLPGGTEGYRTAEVTLGGVDTHQLNQKTMESKCQENLYFIGEVVDVTGHLGGHNFQWAWSSAVAAGRAL